MLLQHGLDRIRFSRWQLLYLKKEGYDLLYFGFDSAVMPTVNRNGLNIQSVVPG
jgi:aryl carrier-like protein